jgi:hypothetical protein
MSDSVKMSVIPPCDLCGHFVSQGKQFETKPAAYDAATIMGSWAYLCEEHFASYGLGLGTGRGQRLIQA